MRRLIVIPISIFIFTSCTMKPFEVVEETYPSGTPKTVKYYKNESKEILLSEINYYEDGAKKMEGSYENGERSGKWSYWYPNDKLWSQGVYKDGKENGLKTVWHSNGQKYYEGNTKDDKRIGIWKFWNDKGELLKEEDYDKE
jgi:antitoxin component YwqK of YwqJK toxin-antitoxin module